MRRAGLIGVILFGAVLLYSSYAFPPLGDPDSPASRHVSDEYIKHGMEETGAPNLVTAVLADYRGYDTMFEATVILAAGIACFFLLRTYRRKAAQYRLYRHVDTGVILIIEQGGREPSDSMEFERIDAQWVPYDLIINKAAGLVVPFLQLFALYVIFHGHHSPGGGFQGGVIFGATVILLAISRDLRSTTRLFPEKTGSIFASAGLFIYAGTGVACLLLGANFLDYGALSRLFVVDPVMARSHGILLVEVGVGMAVSAIMIWIYYNLASAGRYDEGL